MKLIKFLLISAFFLTLIFSNIVGSVTAQTSNYLSDYQYQLDQYRRSYAEYQNFKSDYQSRPTLNNEQKAILSAKQTIGARELAWANYLLYLSEIITSTGVDFPFTNKAVADLSEISKYHFNQAVLGAGIITRSDLTNFTKEEIKIISNHKVALAKAQVAAKLAQLIKLHTDSAKAYQVLLPRLESIKGEVAVQNGLDQIQVYSQTINDEITAMVEKIDKLESTQFSQDTFYSDNSTKLAEIRSNINRLINVIIDLDTNYVRH